VKNISKQEKNNTSVKRGTSGGSKHCNTTKKINEHRITARKVSETLSSQRIFLAPWFVHLHLQYYFYTSTIFHKINCCFCPHSSTCLLNTELRAAEVELLVKLRINENSSGLAAEAYRRLTRKWWSVLFYKSFTSMVLVCHKYTDSRKNRKLHRNEA